MVTDNEIIILDAWAVRDSQGYSDVFTDKNDALNENPESSLVSGYVISGGADIRSRIEELFEDFYENKDDINAILVEENLIDLVNDLSHEQHGQPTFNPTVVHVFRGEGTIVTKGNSHHTVVIDFDRHLKIIHPGWNYPSIVCPHCSKKGSEFQWNVATITDFEDGPGDRVTRIQEVDASDTGFTCAYCFKVSTAADLGLVPLGYTRINFEQVIQRLNRNEQTFYRIQGENEIFDMEDSRENMPSIKEFFSADYFIEDSHNKAATNGNS